jgi:integrase
MERKGSVYRPGGLVFASEVGGIINPANLRNRSLTQLLRLADLPSTTRLHDLRHTCATLLLSTGVHPEFVQELLGHATIAITPDTYSHVLPGMENYTVRGIEDAVRSRVGIRLASKGSSNRRGSCL